LNVVVGSSGGTVQSVTDAAGKTYVLAAGPTSEGYCQGKGVPFVISPSIYFAKSIRSSLNGNTVTVAFNPSGVYRVVKVAEYAGLSTVNPLDAAVGASGNGVGAAGVERIGNNDECA
jgi:hypothetical protein